MAEIDFSRYEIVGFNGTAIVPCGRTLAVGHIKGKDEYFRVDAHFFENGTEHHSVARHCLEEIKGYEYEKRLTMLRTPFPMIKEAMVLYATEEKLTSKGLNPHIEPIAVLNGQNLIWQNLLERDIWVTCSDEKTIEKLLERLKS